MSRFVVLNLLAFIERCHQNYFKRTSGKEEILGDVSVCRVSCMLQVLCRLSLSQRI